MAQLSDYEISQIEKAISNFNDTANRLAKTLQKGSFSNNFREAESKLRSYSNDENRALKEVEKAIDKAMNSSGGFFSSGGLNKILDKKVNDTAKEVGDLIDGYMSDISSIISKLPKLGTVSHFSFSATEYEGDKEYTNDDFDVDFEASVPFGLGISSFDEYESTAKREDDFLDEVIKTNKSEDSSEANNSIFSEYTTEDSLTVLGINAISNPNIKKLRLSKVKEIRANAFKGSDNLELIVISNSIEKINVNAFRTVNRECVIAFECSKARALSLFQDDAALDGRKVIFDYQSGDEILNKSDAYAKPEPEKKKRVIIKKETPLDNDEIKQAYVDRNQKYHLTLDELNEGIKNAGTNVDKEKILYHASLARRINALNEGSYWNYADAVGHALDIAKNSEKLDDVLAMIFGLLYLDSSGYRMVNGKYNPFMDEPSRMCYHPKMEFGVLTDLIAEHNLSESYLVNVYKNSMFVKELKAKFDKPYYSVESSIELMLMAIKMPGDYFYPAQSGIKRIN